MRLKCDPLSIAVKALIAIAATLGILLQCGIFSGKPDFSVLTYFTMISNMGCAIYYTAAAIRLACTAMRTKYMGTRNYHPVVILVTDGESNNRSDTQNAIEELRNALSGGNPAKKDKVWRFAIGVEGYNEAELQDFAMLGTKEDDFGNELPNEPMVFKVDNVADLAKVLKNVTESSLHSAAAAGDTGTAGEAPIIPI